MTDTYSIYFGYAGGSIFIASNFYQIYKMIKAKDGTGLSQVTLLLYALAASLYTCAGFIDNEQYIYAASAIYVLQYFVMMYINYHYRKQKKMENEWEGFDKYDKKILCRQCKKFDLFIAKSYN